MPIYAARYLAAAIFNDAGKVIFVPLENKDRFAALQAGKLTSWPAMPPGRWRAKMFSTSCSTRRTY